MDLNETAKTDISVLKEQDAAQEQQAEGTAAQEKTQGGVEDAVYNYTFQDGPMGLGLDDVPGIGRHSRESRLSKIRKHLNQAAYVWAIQSKRLETRM